MEKLYRKVGKRYVDAGYGGVPDLVPGIWLIQMDKTSRSSTSLVWRVGDIKRPVDVVTHAALQAMGDALTKYLMALGDETSEEFKQAKEILGGYLYGAVGFYNISASDLVSLFLRQIAMQVEEGVAINWRKIMMKFRNESHQYTRHDFEDRVKVLYEFIDFIEKEGYYLSQNKK